MSGRFQLDVRLVGAGILAAATALVVLLLTAPPSLQSVLVTRTAAPGGVPLRSLDVAVREVEDDSGLVLADDAGDLAGHVLVASLGAGAPIPRSLLAAPADRRTPDLLGLELDSSTAVHGLLEGGDTVDVYAAADEVSLIASGVEVIDVMIDSGSLGSGSVELVVAVEGDLAPRLIAAAQAGTMHLVRRGR